MKFTCPHCGKTFEQKTRNVSTSEKANAARRRNGALGGKPRKLSDADLATIFRTRESWTGGEFHTAIEQKTGERYSRTQAFLALKKLKGARVVKVTRGSKVSDAMPKDEPAPTGEKQVSGKK